MKYRAMNRLSLPIGISSFQRVLRIGITGICFFLTPAKLQTKAAYVDAELDHLSPKNLSLDPLFEPILAQKLCKTPFDYGRAIIRPPFEGEVSLSVYSVRRHNSLRYLATLLTAPRSLWQLTDGGHFPGRAVKLKMDRRDSELPEATARLIRDCWQMMLRESKTLHPKSKVITMDTTFAEISLQSTGGKSVAAELNFALAYPGRRTKLFVELWNSINAYIEAGVADKAGKLNLLDSKARELLAMEKRT